jgi:hypothetical protein
LADRNDNAFLSNDLPQYARGERLEFHGSFVGFDVSENLATSYGVPLVLMPPDYGAFLHVVPHLGHDD